MYQNKTTLINNALQSVAALGSKYLDEINEFPSVVVLKPSFSNKLIDSYYGHKAKTTFKHNSNNSILKTYTFIVRGYCYSYEETSINNVEALARDIERAVQSITGVVSADILSISTDEGLLSPYGVCDVQCEIRWYDE